MSNPADQQIMADQVKVMRDKLERAGWVIANAVGEQKTADGILWSTTIYTMGEYTVEASFRPRGAGPAEGVTRIRLTPKLIQVHPRVGVELAQDLVAKGLEITETGKSILDLAWPPAKWKELEL